MAQYKVPQDVEADDKLLGPFTFRQFIYLMIIGGLIALAILLWQIFPLLILIVVPPILLLGALCFPFKKDQPMETYLSALVSFHLKPHTRIWEPGEPDATIVITAPKKVDEVHVKDISQEEASHRLSFLAEIVDTEGYAIKGGVREEVYAEANSAKDIFEISESSTLNQALQANTATRHEELVNQMRQAIARNNDLNGNAQIITHNSLPSLAEAAVAPVTPVQQPQPVVAPLPQPTNPADVVPLSATGAVAGTDPFANQTSAVVQPDLPIPETLHLSSNEDTVTNDTEYLPEDERARLEGREPEPSTEEVIDNTQPSEEASVDEAVAEGSRIDEASAGGENQEITTETPAEPEPAQPSQQMIDLANNPDFSIETIAQQANRISEENNKDEVYISLH